MVHTHLWRATYMPTGQLWFNEKGEPQFNKEGAGKAAGIKSLEILKNLYDYGPKGAAALKRAEAGQIFLAGDSALMLTWPEYVTRYLDDPDASKIVGKWGASNPPGPCGISSAGVYMVDVGEHKEEAWTTMKWIVSPEMMAQAMMSGGYTHARISPFAVPEVKESIPDLAAQLESLMRAFFNGMFTFPAGTAWLHDMGKMIMEYIWSGVTVEETLQKIEDRWYKLNGEAVGKAHWTTYYEQHGLTPPNWMPPQEKIDKAVAPLLK
jgi:ABC-type glycerol-3-phosphate transport system substrate-binding protein